LESVGEDGFYPAVSRQGHRLVYTRSWLDYNIWRIDLPDLHIGVAREGFKSSMVVASSRADGSPAFSPDGKKIVFGSDRTGFPEIWAADADGLNEVQLTNSSTYSGSPSWSPDGTRITFDCNESGHFEIYVMSANGGKPRRQTNGAADSAVPRWSRDGKWLYFRSVRSGENQIWKMPSVGGDAIQVTKKGGFQAAESADGKFLYYTKTDPVSGLWRASVSGGEETRILEAVAQRSFAVVKDGVYYFAPPGTSGRSPLQFLNFTSARTITIGSTDKPIWLYMDVSRDGRWLIYSQRDQRIQNLMLVENFH
jgi:Tol biopolymer transport system component